MNRNTLAVCITTLALAAELTWAAPRPKATQFEPQPPTPEEIQAAPRDGTRLLLLGAIFDPTSQEPDFSRVGLPESVDGAYAIVQFEPGRLDAKDELEHAGVEFVGYLPDNAFQVRL